MTLYRLEVGSGDGVEIRNIVGAIANETGLRSRFIGQIRIHPEYSTVELPDDLPRNMIEHLKKTYVGHKPLKISPARREGPGSGETGPPPTRAKAAVPAVVRKKKPKKAAAKVKHRKGGKSGPKS
jgi:ATP-dependent RNA helicase DeaD